MTIGTLVKPNQKGQIVIPKAYRDELAIDADMLLNLVVRGKGIYIYPVSDVITNAESENVYLKVLEKTQGSWIDEDWDTLKKKRRSIELRASARRKKLW